MIPIFSKILDTPFDDNLKEVFYSCLVDRHKKTLYTLPPKNLNLSLMETASEFKNTVKYMSDTLRGTGKSFISHGHSFRISSDLSALTYYIHNELRNTVSEIIKMPLKHDSIIHDAYAYVSNSTDFKGGIHNHKSTSTFTGVYYLSVPSHDSGRLNFYDDNKNLIYSHQPVKDELIIFPNYLNHYPQKSNSELYRIAINIEIIAPIEWEVPTEYKVEVIHLS
jgi:hypothetical protein